MIRLARTCGAVCALLTVACSSGSGSSPGGAGGATEAGSGGGSGGIGGSAGTSGDAAAETGPPVPDLSGFSDAAIRSVELGISWWSPVGVNVAGWNESSHFRISEPATPTPPQVCIETPSGSCTAYTQCDPPPTPPPAPESLELYPTKVTFTGGTGTGFDWDRWHEGDQVVATIIGNPPVGIPDFQATTTFPPLGGVQTQYGMGQNHYKLYRGSSFTLSYPPGLGDVTLQIMQVGIRIECAFSGDAGAGVVPLELMQLLAKDELTPSGDGGNTGISWGRSYSVPVTAGEFTGHFTISPGASDGGFAQVFDSAAP